ncbi:MAG: hypothetical protein NTV49_05600 [Kiritimatiellaeota bacterium]|nr:hypothetical protein [Kiritimatiellota bacterium]
MTHTANSWIIKLAMIGIMVAAVLPLVGLQGDGCDGCGESQHPDLCICACHGCFIATAPHLSPPDVTPPSHATFASMSAYSRLTVCSIFRPPIA